jgi:polyisoprenoid-binding protein YceI
VETYTEITFVAQQYRVTGNLTIKGVTKPVTVDHR